jgi:hypothetical protein
MSVDVNEVIIRVEYLGERYVFKEVEIYDCFMEKEKKTGGFSAL